MTIVCFEFWLTSQNWIVYNFLELQARSSHCMGLNLRQEAHFDPYRFVCNSPSFRQETRICVGFYRTSDRELDTLTDLDKANFDLR